MKKLACLLLFFVCLLTIKTAYAEYNPLDENLTLQSFLDSYAEFKKAPKDYKLKVQKLGKTQLGSAGSFIAYAFNPTFKKNPNRVMNVYVDDKNRVLAIEEVFPNKGSKSDMLKSLKRNLRFFGLSNEDADLVMDTLHWYSDKQLRKSDYLMPYPYEMIGRDLGFHIRSTSDKKGWRCVIGTVRLTGSISYRP